MLFICCGDYIITHFGVSVNICAILKNSDGVINMEIKIKGKEIKRIRTLHLTDYGSKEDGNHHASFVIYDDFKSPKDKDLTTFVMYFEDKDVESIKIP